MANTNFKIDNGLLVTDGVSLFQANATINAHAIVKQTLSVEGDLNVTGNLTYSNTSIAGDLIPTANGKALGNTSRTFDVYAGNLYFANSIVTANGVLINIRAQSGIIANSTGLYVNASSVGDGILPVLRGGTGGNTAVTAINNLLPTQTGLPGYYLKTDGFNVSWVQGAGFTGSIGFTGSAGSIGFTGSG